MKCYKCNSIMDCIIGNFYICPNKCEQTSSTDIPKEKTPTTIQVRDFFLVYRTSADIFYIGDGKRGTPVCDFDRVNAIALLRNLRYQYEDKQIGIFLLGGSKDKPLETFQYGPLFQEDMKKIIDFLKYHLKEEL